MAYKSKQPRSEQTNQPRGEWVTREGLYLLPFPVFPAVGAVLMLALMALTPACKKETSEPDWATSFAGCDVKKWPKLLPLAKRSQNEQISVTFYGDEKAPTVSDSFHLLRTNEEQKCL